MSRRATDEKSTSKPERCQVNVDYFFDCEGVVHYEFTPRGQMINKGCNVEVLKRLRDAVRRKRNQDDSEQCDARAEGHSKIIVRGLL